MSVDHSPVVRSVFRTSFRRRRCSRPASAGRPIAATRCRPGRRVLALKNALRYVPPALHEAVAPEFLSRTAGAGAHLRVPVPASAGEGCRRRPGGRPRAAEAAGNIKARPVDQYRGHPGGAGTPAQHRQQPGLRRRSLSLRVGHLRGDGPGVPELDAVPAGEAVSGADDRDPDAGRRFRASGRPVPEPPRRSPGHQHERADGGGVRRPGGLPRGGPTRRGQLRADDGRRLDVHRAPGDRARHLSDAAERRAPVPGDTA